MNWNKTKNTSQDLWFVSGTLHLNSSISFTNDRAICVSAGYPYGMRCAEEFWYHILKWKFSVSALCLSGSQWIYGVSWEYPPDEVNMNARLYTLLHLEKMTLDSPLIGLFVARWKETGEPRGTYTDIYIKKIPPSSEQTCNQHAPFI